MIQYRVFRWDGESWVTSYKTASSLVAFYPNLYPRFEVELSKEQLEG